MFFFFPFTWRCLCWYLLSPERLYQSVNSKFFLHSVLAGEINFLYISCIFVVVSDSLRLHGLQHTRLPCPSPTPGACSNSCPLSRWCHPIVSSSVIPFSFCLQSFSASGSFLVSQFFASGGGSIGGSASAPVLSMNIQGWFPFAAAAAKSLKSCLTLCDPTDGSPRGSPVPGILQARTLEWVAISFSSASLWPEVC